MATSTTRRKTATGIIFDIKRFAIHDGPGIRTTVFFKGCPLSCRWCHNPEGLASAPKGIYQRDRCIICGECLAACPHRALTLSAHGVETNPSLCNQCRTCADICPAEARTFAGRIETATAVMETIEKDLPFYETSGDDGGGVTFSGGEPLMQPEFLLELLDACGRRGIHRAVDTTGFADADVLRDVAENTDLFLFDIKHMDPEKHEKYTGVSNEKILQNLQGLSRRGAGIIIRLPLLPGINDDDDNIDRTGAFLSGFPGIRHVDLLPFHNASVGKYRKFCMPYRAGNIKKPSKTRLTNVAKRLIKYHLTIKIG